MPEIIERGTPPTKYMYRVACSSGTIARFHQDEATDHLHINMGPVRRITFGFTCPVCDASGIFGDRDGIAPHRTDS